MAVGSSVAVEKPPVKASLRNGSGTAQGGFHRCWRWFGTWLLQIRGNPPVLQERARMPLTHAVPLGIPRTFCWQNDGYGAWVMDSVKAGTAISFFTLHRTGVRRNLKTEVFKYTDLQEHRIVTINFVVQIIS